MVRRALPLSLLVAACGQAGTDAMIDAQGRGAGAVEAAQLPMP